MPDKLITKPNYAVPEREIVTLAPRRISRNKEKVLGTAHVGEGIFLWHGGAGRPRNNQAVYRDAGETRGRWKFHNRGRIAASVELLADFSQAHEEGFSLNCGFQPRGGGTSVHQTHRL